MRVHVYFDCQVALKPLNSCQFNSELEWGYWKSLKHVKRNNQVYVACFRVFRNFLEIKNADTSAQNVTESPLIGPEPVCEIFKSEFPNLGFPKSLKSFGPGILDSDPIFQRTKSSQKACSGLSQWAHRHILLSPGNPQMR